MVKKPTNQEVLDFLKSVSIMSVSINYETPISTILLFAVDGDFTFYFATQKNSFKDKALNLDNKISLSVWEHGKMLVQASGVAKKMEDEKEASESLTKIVNALDNINDFWPPVLRFHGDDYVIYQIETNWLRVLDLSEKTIYAEDSPFFEIKNKQ